MSKITLNVSIIVIMLFSNPYNCYAQVEDLTYFNFKQHPWNVTISAEKEVYKIGEYRDIMLNVTWQNNSKETISVDANSFFFSKFNIMDQTGEPVELMGQSMAYFNEPEIITITLKPGETYSTKQPLFFLTIPLNLKPGNFFINNPGWFFSEESVSSNTVEIKLVPGEATELSDNEKNRYLWDNFNRKAVKKLRDHTESNQ